ncbi:MULTISPECIES: hypothetical protein [Mycobacterium]|nr:MULTISPECIES: hypothetical protein [Mycobacterium]
MVLVDDLLGLEQRRQHQQRGGQRQESGLHSIDPMPRTRDG